MKIVNHWRRMLDNLAKTAKGDVIFTSSPSEVLCKKVFLEISQNSQENTYARVSF